MGKYRRVACVDRCHIFMALNRGLSVAKIAEDLGFNKSSIYRELKRNRSERKYNPVKADERAQLRFSRCRRKYKIQGELEDLVQYYLFEGWSPDQISGRLRFERSTLQVSHQSIYNFLEYRRDDLQVLLKRYNKRGGGRTIQRKTYQDRLHVTQRDHVIKERKRIGDYERDCMRFSKIRPEVLVCTDRKSRFTKLALAKEMTPRFITDLTLRLIGKKNLKTITNDNGLEFRDSKNIKKPVYFCDPGRPDQRGTVENTIGRLRFYLPKSADPRLIDLKEIEKQYNQIPRKCLDYKTPYEVFYDKRVALAI
jgi:transposase, IS30 family